MIVKRIVTNIATVDASKARRFYKDVLGLEIVMDQSWIGPVCSSNADVASSKCDRCRRVAQDFERHRIELDRHRWF
ncbi:MAG TPA: hypothetical protein VH934_10885 [Xanthobacteraceae bacterium]|jgi:hypothetical protein